MYIKPNNHPKDIRFFAILLFTLTAAVVLALAVAAPSLLVRSDPPADTYAQTTPPVTSTDPATDSVSADTTAAPPLTTDPPETTPPVTQTEPPITEPKPALLGATEDAGQEYIDKIIFIGDSTTYSLLYYGMLSGGKETTQVWTPASRTLTLDHAPTTTILYPDTNEEITIKEAISRKKPEIVVITLGVNGISYMQEEYFISVYTKLVGQIQDASPDTKIILQSIFPIAANYEKQKSINNEKITTANEWIKAVAEDTCVRYLDTISVLAVGEDGYLPAEWQNGDGLHLNPTSLNIVLEYIRTHALPDYAEPIS